MPVKLGSKLPADSEARIEIIPLIDIMFFLLAAFMLVSLSMVNLRSVQVALPAAATGAPDAPRNLVHLAVDKTGLLSVDQQPIGHHELIRLLTAAQRTNPAVRVLLSGDQDTRHGDIIRALDLVRATGIERVSFELRATSAASPP